MRRAPVTVVTALVAALALSGCGGGEVAPSPSSEGPASASGFVLDEDFPDPDIVSTDAGYTAFATGSHGLNIRVATSPDLANWTVDRRDALPTLPAWASPGRTWAPEVAPLGEGFVMYVTAEHTASGRQCVGVATSASLDDPFTPASDEPLVCPVDAGGAIDAATFDDEDGGRYLLWKTDGNCCALDTRLMIAPLSGDGLSLQSEPVELLTQDQPWEGALVEAPTLVARDGGYALLYSANDYGGDSYAVGVAWAPTLTGPYTKQSEPFLSTTGSDGAFRGPGGQDVVATPNGDVLVFHGWDEQYIYRGLHTAPIDLEPGGATVDLG
ncbi:Glycosyl hydrolase, family 43 [Microbacterium oleivorans]|uniref:Glycosyl hydrolase, family 43 n=1 Tax=Microbacterium oleivorans TaxID=273677 RepID=A0A031FUR5_9MICO|nr:Glycosyl hydrolase, family 43 [Microbacterium oleivorans]